MSEQFILFMTLVIAPAIALLIALFFLDLQIWYKVQYRRKGKGARRCQQK